MGRGRVTDVEIERVKKRGTKRDRVRERVLEMERE